MSAQLSACVQCQQPIDLLALQCQHCGVELVPVAVAPTEKTSVDITSADITSAAMVSAEMASGITSADITSAAMVSAQYQNMASLDGDTIIFVESKSNTQQQALEESVAKNLPAVPPNSMAHFKIIDILGKGGMGAVYKAKDIALERYVAIKMIRAISAEHSFILDEAKTISKLNHPNIVTVYDIARGDEANFIVMEWIDGLSLNNHIPSQGMSVKKALTYARQMVSALASAHKQQVIHRDIKPQNIMVDADGRIKILDFGISALIKPEQVDHQEQYQNSPTEVLALVGTPQYMAPEQINGQYIDARSDLFSLGIVLYEMLTGTKPFLGLNIGQITRAISDGHYTSLAELKPELPSEMVACVDKLLQAAPTERYQDAEAMAHDLDALHHKLTQKKNWWQQQHWLIKALAMVPLVTLLGWSVRELVFPPTTQELIQRQLLESRKIAFLPFDNISGDPVLQIFSDGVATMLSNDLAAVGLSQGDGTTWVMPTSEIKRLDDPSIENIYNKYGVDIIITGSIQHMGLTRSVSLSLINGSDGRQLKSVQLSIDANALFAAQTKIRREVMALIGWQIPAQLTEQFAAKKPAFDDAYKHYLAGQGYLYRFDQANNIERSLESFKAAISIDSSYSDAYAGLAQAQLRSFILSQDVNLLTRMSRTIDKLEEIDTNHVLLSYLQGQLMLNQGSYAHSVKLFSRSIQRQPSFSRAYTGLSYTYIQLGEMKKAERVLLTAYEFMPNNSAILTDLGGIHYRNGDYSRAIEYFSLLAQQAPNNFTAFLNLSACYYLKGDIANAILTAEQSLKIQKTDIAYSNIGTAYFMLKDYQKSVQAFEKMIALNDSYYINWGNLADAYRFANNGKYRESYEKAIVLAEQALLVNPNSKYAIASLAYYYANIENRDKAIYYAQQITSKDSGDDAFLIAAAYVRLNMKVAALTYLEFAIINNYSITEMMESPLLEQLKSDSRYLQLMKVEVD